MAKFFFTILFWVGLVAFSWSQSYQTILTEKVLVEQQTFYLNSKTRIGGKTRNYIKIDFPPNTIGWYYVFTTTPADKGNQAQSINLAKQIAGFIGKGVLSKTGAGMAANIAYQIVKPTGANVCDIYLCDRNGYNSFFETDALGLAYAYEKPACYLEGTKENAKDGTFFVDDLKQGTAFLCFKNPSAMEGLNVHIEAVAIIEEQQYVDVWTAENKQNFYKNCLNSFINKGEGAQEICNCGRDKIVEKYTPKTFDAISAAEKEQQLLAIYENCIVATNNTELFNAETKIRELLSEVQGLEIIKDYPRLAEVYSEIIQLGVKDESTYNSAAWYSLLSKKFDAAKDFLIKGLSLKPNNLYLLGNLANYHLLTGKPEEALEIYKKYKKKKLRRGLSFKTAVKDDLNLLERNGMYNPDFDKVRKALKIK